MTIHFIVGVLDGEITDLVSKIHMTASQCENHFPLGEVYMYAEEPQGMQWRVLQRTYHTRRRGRSIRGTFPALLPSSPEDVPEIVRMIALVRS